MAHGTARAAATTVLGLIALQAVGSKGGSGRITELFRDVNGILEHLLDPAVPAIPDRRHVARGRLAGGTARATPSTPGQQYGSANAADHWTPPSPGYRTPGRVGGTY